MIPRLTQIAKGAQTLNPSETLRRFKICRSLDRKGQLLVENLGLQNEVKCGIVGAIKKKINTLGKGLDVRTYQCTGVLLLYMRQL